MVNLDKIDPIEYNLNYRLYQDGRLSEETWKVYCDALFSKILDQNKDVLIRLKDR